MKLSIIKSEPFYNLGTVVLYKERKFYPDSIPQGDKENYEKLLTEEYGTNSLDPLKAEKVLFKTKVTSDLLELAGYDFKFDLRDNKDYPLEFFPDRLTQESILHLARNKELSNLSDSFLPQVIFGSTEDTRLYGCFGRATSLDNVGNLYFLPVSSGIWKLELYNEDCLLSNCEYGFVDYDILNKYYSDKITSTPYAQIYLGPQHDSWFTGLSARTAWGFDDEGESIPWVYNERYLSYELFEPEYETWVNSSKNEFKTKNDYIEMFYNEVRSEKILSLSCSESDITTTIINLQESLNSLNNPYRNLNSYYLRSDRLSQEDSNLVEDDRYGIKKDLLSGRILCSTSISDEDTPIFNIRENLAPTVKTLSTKKITVGDKTYITDKASTTLTKNPIISPDWILDREIETDYLRCYVSTTKGGSASPSGIVTVKRDNKLEVEISPENGYIFKGATPDYTLNGNKLLFQNLENREKINIVYKKLLNCLTLTLKCEDDYITGNKKEEFTKDFPITVLYNIDDSEEVEMMDELVEIENFIDLYFSDEDSGYSLDNYLINRTDGTKIELEEITYPEISVKMKHLRIHPKDFPSEIYEEDEKSVINLVGTLTVDPVIITIISYGDIQSKDQKIFARYNSDVSISFSSYSHQEITNITATDDHGEEVVLPDPTIEGDIYTLNLSGVTKNLTIKLNY